MPRMFATLPLLADPDAITPAWFTQVLRHAGVVGDGSRVVAADGRPIGTGQVGANVRYTLRYEGEPGPSTLVCKFASRDPESRAAGISTLTYETEVGFYRDLAPSVAVSRPRCFHADIEPGTANVVLVLEDLHPAEQGDQLDGCTVDQAALVIDEAAKLHGPRWGDPTLRELAWLNRDRSSSVTTMLPTLWEGFVERYGQYLAAVTIDRGQHLMGHVDAWTTREPPPEATTVVHGDFRLDNLLFDPSGRTRPVTVVDWQTVRLGPGAHDVAYFLGSAFADPAVRRSCEDRLLRRYHDGLLAHGVRGYSFDQCWEDYRRSSYACLLMAIIASMIVGRTERGDRMFIAMADRSAQLAADVDAASLLRQP